MPFLAHSFLPEQACPSCAQAPFLLHSLMPTHFTLPAMSPGVGALAGGLSPQAVASRAATAEATSAPLVVLFIECSPMDRVRNSRALARRLPREAERRTPGCAHSRSRRR